MTGISTLWGLEGVVWGGERSQGGVPHSRPLVTLSNQLTETTINAFSVQYPVPPHHSASILEPSFRSLPQSTLRVAYMRQPSSIPVI